MMVTPPGRNRAQQTIQRSLTFGGFRGLPRGLTSQKNHLIVTGDAVSAVGTTPVVTTATFFA